MSRRRYIRILCLDGGDGRCVSQLFILNELMYQLEQSSGKKIRPCDYFDFIIGVDSSAIIAAFLGLFKMTPEEAQEAFFDVHKAVFEGVQPSQETQARRLETIIKETLRSRNLPETIKLSDPSFAEAAKVALCCVSTAHMNHCRLFRNYRSPQQITQDVTIVEALCTSWATPGLIAPTLIGPAGREERLSSAVYGFSNPMQEAIKEAYNVFGADTQVSSIVSLGQGYGGTTSIEDKDVRTSAFSEIVADDMQNRLGHLRIYHRFLVDHGLEQWSSQDGFGVLKSEVDAYLSRNDVGRKLKQCLEASRINMSISLGRIYQSNAPSPQLPHGLPPLSAYFVMRRKPMTRMIRCLIESDGSTQRMMVISGLGGIGKTQLALKFAHDFGDRYRQILFIDASSTQNIQRTLLTRVRALCPDNPPATAEEAVDILASSGGPISRDWFLIFDNADNPDVNISSFLPPCDHGTVLITTRDGELESLSPNSYLALDTMEPDEAVDALLACVFPSQLNPSSADFQGSSPTSQDREAAEAICQELGHLPIAIIQAGCYIRQHKTLHQYLDRLKSSRAELLNHPTRIHRDKLKYPHGVYASFHIAIGALSPRSVQLLSILSFFHYSHVPRLLITIAAKSKFTLDQFDLLERPPGFSEAVQLLYSTLSPNGRWSEVQVDGLFEELQRYSFVTAISVHLRSGYRFHPLVLQFAQDRMTMEEQARFQASAMRLLVSGITKGDDEYLFDDLLSHIAAFDSKFNDLHVNDRAAIAMVLRHEAKDPKDIKHRAIWTQILTEVEEVHGEESIRASRASLHLAAARGGLNKQETVSRIVRFRERELGPDHLETLEALSILAEGAPGKERWGLLTRITRLRISKLGLFDSGVADTMMKFAYVPSLSKKDQLHFLSAATVIRTRLFGRSAQRTCKSLTELARCYGRNGFRAEATRLREEVLAIQSAVLGDQSYRVTESIRKLAASYLLQGMYDDAIRLLQSRVEISRRSKGQCHDSTISAISSLARVYFDLGKFEDARLLYSQVMKEWPNSVEVVNNLIGACLQLRYYSEAEEVCPHAYENFFLEQAQSLMADLSRRYFEQGLFERSQERLDETEKLWKRALRLCLMVDVRYPPSLTSSCFEQAVLVSRHLALLYHKQGYPEAAELAEEAMESAMELSVSVPAEDDDDPPENIRRLIDVVMQLTSSSMKETHPAVQAVVSETEDGISDPGGDPTHQPQSESIPVPQSATLFQSKPPTPFVIRSMFRGPTSWSMF